eukprot:maker-scaffold68_size422247-snap-gene-2.18 protein:Tk11398 transcript:maker-scaffold68_size422247-snap-gene-2.18-mRNA-1 annotation:"lytic transglycosylase"
MGDPLQHQLRRRPVPIMAREKPTRSRRASVRAGPDRSWWWSSLGRDGRENQNLDDRDLSSVLMISQI